jgi:hypothetical protein
MTSNGVFSSDTQAIPAVSATAEELADGVDASATGGTGVSGTSGIGVGVQGFSNSGTGVVGGTEGTGQGVFASSLQGIGLLAVSGEGFETPPAVQAAIATQSLGSSSVGVFATTNNGTAVSASDQGSGTGVQASSASGTAVQASSASGTAVFAQSGTGDAPHPPPGIGVHAVGAGASPTNVVSQAAIFAEGGSGFGVVALTTNGSAVTASDGGQDNGLLAGTNGGVAVNATDNGSGVGVNAISNGGTGVIGNTGTGTGVLAAAENTSGVALQVNGRVQVQGLTADITAGAATETVWGWLEGSGNTGQNIIINTHTDGPNAARVLVLSVSLARPKVADVALSNLLIRSSMGGWPDPFRSVRDLDRVPARCSWPSGIPESRSPRWLPAWLPVSEGRVEPELPC